MAKKKLVEKGESRRKMIAVSAEYHAMLAKLAEAGHRDIGSEVERLIAEEYKRQSGGDLRDLAQPDAAGKAEQ